MTPITIVGGGLAGLVAAITCAEAGEEVSLLEAHAALGGRARSSSPPHIANYGPHVLYSDGPEWTWLRDRNLVPPHRRAPLTGLRFRHGGRARRTPPLDARRAFGLRRREAPVDASFREWATAEAGPEFAAIAASAAGVFSFDHDPGRLSAAFVWERLLRVTTLPPAARYVTGGWTPLVESLERRARDLGVSIATGTRVEELPPAPVVVATELEDARRLLGEDLHWESGHCVCLDFAVRERRGDPFVISDLDEAGWVERFSAADPTLAPAGESLVQAQIGVRPGESVDEATARVEALIDCGFAHRAERQTWHRRVVIERRSGALDLPGTTWRDRPAVDRGDGRFLAGDKVAAPGLLSEVAWASAIEAARGAIAWRTGSREPSAVV